MVPELTDEQRLAALAKANKARRMRHSIKAALKAGTLDPVRAIGMEDVGRMRVRDFIKALPGAYTATADRAMRRLGIAEGRRMGGLGRRQTERLIDWIENREH